MIAQSQRAPKGSPITKVVCVSWIPELARTRELLLSNEGYEVTTILGKEQLSGLNKIAGSSLLVLAHSVPQEEKLQALHIFRRNCGGPVLSLLRPHATALPDVDYAVEALDPAEFIRAVKSVASKRQRLWKVGCKSCDLIFKVSLPVTKEQSVTLRCPYCTRSGSYGRDDLRPLTSS
jgi:hypothetical protein